MSRVICAAALSVIVTPCQTLSSSENVPTDSCCICPTFYFLIISWLIMGKSIQIVHNGSDNNYHFNRLFCRDIKKSAV
ncbi:Uncharacterised protein [Yersinia enterocolitica]|nr:Uncharacterised protein [Yersinia enterocolitica]